MIFISDRCKKMHCEYLREMKLKMSIFEKSYPDMVGGGVKDILRSRANRAERERAAALKADILSHDIYFSSFGESNERCELIRHTWGSEAAFLHLLYNECIEADGGFLLLYLKGRELCWSVGRELVPIFTRFNLVLAHDLAEHAYFEDYGFDRSRYVTAALSRINLSKIEKHIEKKAK